MTDAQYGAIMTKLEELAKGLEAWKASAAATKARETHAPDGGMLLPNYGRAKNTPVKGASRETLEFYKGGCERSLADESKARWHDKERSLLEAINAELGTDPLDAPPQDAIPF